MKRTAIAAGVLASLAVATTARAETPVTLPSLPILSSQFPLTFNLPPNPTLTTGQIAADIMSWRAFVSLNWPVNDDGSPNNNQTIGQFGDNFPVWQTWSTIGDIFRPYGAPPIPWGQQQPVPAVCEQLSKKMKGRRLVLHQTTKTSDLLQAFVQPFNTGPLIDLNSAYAQFEIRYNKTAYDYINNNQLYNTQGQANFANNGGNVSFPCSDPTSGQVGGIMLKGAWKLMGANDDPSKFHTTEALVYNPGSAQPYVAESCQLQTVGMVGFHIGYKPQNLPQWLWATFEHVRNAPQANETPSGQYNFYKVGSTTTPNQMPPPPWNPALGGTPVQVVREVPIADSTKAVNLAWQTALRSVNASSVWQNYMLVSTQWPTVTQNSCTTPAQNNQLGNPFPQFLANITLETYIQGTTPQASSTCVGCHGNAIDTAGKFGDYLYGLATAQTVPTAKK